MTEFEKELDNMDNTELATTDSQRIEDIRDGWRRNRAQMTLWANRQSSPAAETATLMHSEKLGLPVAVVRQMDNRELDKIDASEFSPEAQELIIGNPSLGVYFRQEAQKLNNMLDAIYYGNVPAEARKRRVEDEIRQNGYSPEQIVALRQAGYQQDAGGKWYFEEKREVSAAEERYGLTSSPVTRRYVDNPVLNEWYLGPTERVAAANNAVMDVLKSGDVKDVNEYPGVNGRDLTRALLNDITLVRLLEAVHGGYWKDFNDDELREAVGTVADAFNRNSEAPVVSVDNLDLSRLRARTMSENTEFFRKMGNPFGVTERVAKWVKSAPNSKQLAWIANNLDQATEDQIANLNEYLLEEHRKIRGASTGVQWFEGTADNLRFMGEMYLTRGLVSTGAATNATAPLWKRLLGKAGTALLEEGVRAVGAYLPGAIVDELREPDNLVIDFNAAGEMEAALTPKVAGEMSANIFNKLLDQYIENISERSGNALDAILPTGKILSAAVSDKVKNAAVAKVVTDAYGKLTKTQWVSVMKNFYKDVNVNGALPEILEEKFADGLRAVSTSVAKKLGTDFGDLGRQNMFGHVSDEVNMMAQVGTHTALLRAPVMIGGIYERRALANFADVQRTVKEQIAESGEFSQSPQAVKAFYLQTGLPQAAHITPEKLREISDGEKGGEVLEALGISESEIAEAEVNENILVVNLADAMAKLDPEIHGELMKRVTQFSSASVETVSDWDAAITQKAVDVRAQEAEEFVEAYDKAIAELTALDLPDRTIRAASKIFGNFAHYFGRESSISGAEWIRTVGFEMMKKEDWDKQVRQALYQTAGVKKGATSYNPNIDKMSFNETWEATITLFEGAADASTLIHEIEHYAHHMMELLVEAGMASERMQEDLAKLKEWGTLTPEAAQKGYEEYVAELKAADPKAVPASFEVWKDVQYHENVAKALEAFVIEGKAPSSELIGAFAHLKKILKGIYRTVEALGVNLNDDVRNVFRGMMATEEVIEREDVMRDVISAINESGVLGLGRKGIKSFKRLVALRNDQVEAELEAERIEKVRELRTQWEKEARALIDEDRAMSTWRAIVKYGGMNYKAVEEIAGKAAADELLARGLLREVKKSVSGGGTHPATFAANHGYSSVDEMLADLLDAQDPKEFIEDFLRDCEDLFDAEFAMTESAMTVKATSDMLDALVMDLETLSGKEGKALRKEELRARAEAEIDGKTVLWVRKDTSLVKEVKDVVNKLTEAISKQDYDTALKEALTLQRKLSLAKAKAEGKKLYDKFVRNLRKGRSAKKGRMDGHYQDALRDLSDRLGLSKPLQRKLTSTVKDVIKEHNEKDPTAKIELTPEAREGEHPIDELTLGQLRDLFNIVEFLRIEGRDIVMIAKQQRWDAIRQNTATIVEALRNNKKLDLKEDNKVFQALSWAVTLESKLRNVIGWADNWAPNGALTKILYEPIMKAGSYALQMANKPSRDATNAMNQLVKNSSRWDIRAIRDIMFPEDLRRRFRDYTKWDAKKVIMACLNMGNATNRQRLIEGFEWGKKGDEYCERIAGLLSENDWQLVQKIWDAINSDHLVTQLEKVFYETYHYDMKKEPPREFDVVTSDGKTIRVRGGYMPLRYATNKSPKTKEDEIGRGGDNAPAEHRRPSFSHERVEGFVAPLDLNSPSAAVEHIMDVAHYVTHVEAVRSIMPIVRSAEFRDEFVLKAGKPRYRMLVKLMENVAAPGEWMKGNTTWAEEQLRNIKVASALFGSISTVLKQPASIFTGVEELGGHYLSALGNFHRHPIDSLNFVKDKSGFMANRIGKPELDLVLRTVASWPPSTWWGKIRSRASTWGFAASTAVDAWVVVPQWLAAYNKALLEGAPDADAIAVADEFVAKTQGGSRPIDLSPSDLNVFWRSVMMFHSAASAAATTATRVTGKLRYKRYTAPHAVMAIAGSIVAPLLLEALASWLTRGRDDEDDFTTSYWRHIMGSVMSFTDLTDAAWKSLQGDSVEITAVTVLKTLKAIPGTGASLAEGNIGQAIYQFSDLVSTWSGIPVLTAYDRIIKNVEDWADEDVSLDIKEMAGLKKPNHKRR